MKQKTIIAESIFFSILLHAIAIGLTFFVWIPRSTGLEAKRPIPPPVRKLEIKSVHLRTEKALRPGKIRQVEKLKFEKPDSAGSLEKTLETGLLQPGKVEAPKELSTMTQKDISLSSPDSRTALQAAALPEIKENVQIRARVVIRKKSLESVNIDDANLIQLINEWVDETDSQMPEEFSEEMPAFTPGKNNGSAEGMLGKMVSGSDGLVNRQAFRPDSNRESLDEFLDVRILTYRDPADGQGYYQIAIYPSGAAKNLEVMPKEIIFLMDASLSIKYRRLYAFKEGIKYALNHLNPQDRFNLYVFKNKIIAFSPESLGASPAVISNAMNFLENQTSSRTTNIYSAFLETIQKQASIYPSYIVLLSDGNATSGVVSSARLISQITRQNAGSRPIFAFSGGHIVNRFLLDFLAYPNRGWAEYAKLTGSIKPKLIDFYDKIKNPVLLNVKYQLSGLEENQAYPQNLPDFYRDTVFTVYGKFSTEGKFSMRVTGTIQGKTKEFIFSTDLAEAGTGTEEIARYWAFNKIYHLISEMTLKESDPAAKQEIRNLIQKYGLQMPYDFEQVL